MRKFAQSGLMLSFAATWLGVGGMARAQQPLDVFVTARQGVQPPADEQKKALRKEARSKAKEANKTRSTLEKDLRKQHGKDASAWPAEAADAFLKATNTWGESFYQAEYLDADQKDVDDSAGDIKRAIAGKGMLTRAKDLVHEVAGAADADLVAEVVSRRSWKSTPFQVKPDWYYLCLKLSAGGRVDAAKFGAIGYRWPGNVAILHFPTASEPFWMLEPADKERWYDLANYCSQLLQSFIGDNNAALLAARTKK